MREEEPAPPPPIKPRPGPASGGCSTRAENEAAGGVRSAGGVRGAGRRPASPPPAPLPPRPGALPRPLPRAQRRSYRNSAGSWCRDAPRGGPGPRGRAPEVREEGEREKFEKQASRGEPDKPGPGRAGAVARPGRGLGPRELGAGSRAGEGAAPRRLGTGWEGRLGSPEARAPWLRGAPRDAAPRRESGRVAGAPPPAPPRPEPQTAVGSRGGGARPGVRGAGGSVAPAGEQRCSPRSRSRGVGRPSADGGGPARPRPSRLGPPPARPAPSFPSAPTPRPGSSTQTFRPARSLLRARRLPLQPGSFHTFRPAPSPRPPFPGPPLSSSGPGGAARPERPPELGPGRNELIARYIKLRTGKTRTRKQVSSHIQVLARKKVREYQVGIKAMNLDQVSKDKALQSMASMSSAQIVSASVLQNKFSPPSPLPQAVFSTSSRFWSSPPLLGQQPGPSQDIKPFAQPAYPIQPPLPPTLSTAASAPVWQDRTIASSRLRLLEYSAFMEVQRDPDTYSKHLFVHIGQTNPAFSDPPLEAVDVRQIYDKFPEKKGGLKELYEKGPPNAFFLVKFWADLNSTIQEGPGAFYGVSSQYSSTDSMTISVSTKVCSFGKQVVEKVETEYARLENGRFVYRIHRSPMCEYMINFIHKLKHLPEKYMMNSVLENFTILQVVTSRDSQETLLVIAFVFEVSTSEHGAQHHVYKLVKD
uniref:TEA domain transcription factor 3 n=1 Tax=Canis lupus familiaris TaxID=9615 RepID=A0A8P0S794_CANLF